jgi:predicted enzyme related to lactoylglutathione lyase
MPVNGPDFISLQVRDMSRSANFYETFLGLTRQPGPPHAVVFDTKPIAFAVREAAVDLDSIDQPGQGMALWMHATEVQAIHDALAAAGTPIVLAPTDGPFGRTFTFADPDGYHVTLHDRV